MNGALATPAARRPAAESAARSTAAAPVRAPARELAAPPAAAVAAPARAPGTRERMQASFGAAEAAPAAPAVGESALALAPPTEGRPTTRDRIVNRALAEPTAAPPAAEPERAAVVDIAEVQDRRRQRRAEPAPAAPEAEGPLAPVIDLAARRADVAAPRTDVTAAAAPARGPPKREPEAAPAPPARAEPTAGAVPAGPTPEAQAGAAPARAGPEAGPAPAAEPEAAAQAEPARPGAAPEAAAVTAAEPSAEEAPAPAEAAARAAAAPAPEAEAKPSAPAAPEAAVAPPPPAPVPGRDPEAEPGFQALKANVGRAAVRTKRHQPGIEGAATAQGASQPDPQKDVDSQAATDHVDSMSEKEPGPFDPGDFKAQVKKKIEAMAPPATLEEADEFEESGKAGQATGAIHSIVTGGRQDSEHDIKVTTETDPDSSTKQPKTVSKMVNDAPGPPLPEVGAAAALPGRRAAEETDLSAGPREVDDEMAKGNLTEDQLADANEPEFGTVLEARQAVREHSEAGPADYRLEEDAVLGAGRAEAENVAAQQLEGMHGARVGTLGAVLGAKNETKTADQQARDTVHQTILDIHTRTRADVETILGSLDKAVDTMFTDGEQTARKNFEDYVDRKMREYKADRYGGLFGGAKWLKDKIFDLPDEVNEFYEKGRSDYLDAMDGVIDTIATFVGLMLGMAKLRIEAGRAEVKTYVDGLDKSMRTLGEETAADLDNDFDQLASDVDAKRDELIDAIAHKYVESRDALDSRIEELKEANKGLVSRAIDAIKRVVKTIYELGKLLLRVLIKAAQAIGDIVAHPIRFLGNLIDAIKGGLDRFIERFPVHLQESLLDLLFGEIGKAGITMPAQLDFAGIVDLVLQVLGLTYANIRERVAARFGEPVVAAMEQKVDIFTTLVKDGVGGLWTWIREKLGDLEDLVIGKIKEYVTERVVRAGIGYIIALLNPAAAFIKACQGIYQIVMFIVDRAKQIADFVDAILDSIIAIAQGNVGTAIEKIDAALAGALTLAIGFLARLANLGALSEKVRSIIAVIRRPITRVVDGIVFGAAELYRRTLGPAIAFGKAKVHSGMDWAKGKIAAGRAAAAKHIDRVKVKFTHREVADHPAAAPHAEPQAPAPEHEEAPQPVRVAEDQIDVAPDEHHTVFAQLGPTGQIYLGVTSVPQLVTDLVAHFEPRIDTLPVTPPARLPKGGQKNDRPRSQAEAAATRIVKQAGKLEFDFEHDYEARRALHRTASMRGFAGVYRPAPSLTARLVNLGDSVKTLLRMFYAYDKPRFERVEDEPATGQKLVGRVWATPGHEGAILPAEGKRGLHPTLAGGTGFQFLAPDPHLAPATRGAVREGAAEKARGIVMPPDPTRREVVVRSWAIGGRPDHGSNASHTETQFYHWLVAQGDEFHERVTAIELRSVLSPCGDCTALLTGISKLVRNRPPGARLPTLVVFWDKVYGNKEGDTGPAAATFQRHLVYLGDAGWIVHGPTPSA